MPTLTVEIRRVDGDWEFEGDCNINGDVLVPKGDYEIVFRPADDQTWEFHGYFIQFKDMSERKPPWKDRTRGDVLKRQDMKARKIVVRDNNDGTVRFYKYRIAVEAKPDIDPMITNGGG